MELSLWLYDFLHEQYNCVFRDTPIAVFDAVYSLTGFSSTVEFLND